MTTMIDVGQVRAALGRVDRLCDGDGEFELTSRYWTGSLRLTVDGSGVEADIDDGRIAAVREVTGEGLNEPGHFGFEGPAESWQRLLAPVPEPMHNDIVPAQYGGMVRNGHRETYWQYFPAVRRVIDLLRDECTRAAHDSAQGSTA